MMGRNKNKHFPFSGLKGHPYSTPCAGKLPCADQPPLLQPQSPSPSRFLDRHPGPPTRSSGLRAGPPLPGAYLSDLVNFRNACRRSWKDLYVCGSAEMPCARVVRGPM